MTVVTVRFFGPARDAAGSRESEIGGQTVGEVLAAACTRYGDGFANVLSRSKVWVNGEPAAPQDVVTPSDEVAVLPPVSGG